MAVIASAAAVIYWSAPLNERRSGQRSRAKLCRPVLPEVAAAAEQPDKIAATLSSIPSSPAGSVGTRAEALVTGEAHETDF